MLSPKNKYQELMKIFRPDGEWLMCQSFFCCNHNKGERSQEKCQEWYVADRIISRQSFLDTCVIFDAKKLIDPLVGEITYFLEKKDVWHLYFSQNISIFRVLLCNRVAIHLYYVYIHIQLFENIIQVSLLLSSFLNQIKYKCTYPRTYLHVRTRGYVKSISVAEPTLVFFQLFRFAYAKYIYIINIRFPATNTPTHYV